MRAAVRSQPLDPAALLAEVASHACGAELLFVGTVREVNDGKPVTGIEYSAYGPMALREMQAIGGEAEGRWPGARVVIEHRVGTLALGEASVVIAVAHPHRAECYDASRYVIEALKARVPVWKRELYVDGTREWVEGSSSPVYPLPSTV